MSTELFIAGQTVYLENGAACEFVAAHGSSFIVSPQMNGDEDESFFGRPITVSRVFAKPPVEIIEARCAQLLETEKNIREKLETDRRLEQAFDRNAKERAARFKLHKALERIDDFIQGKITHYVIKHEHGGGVKISTPKEEKCGDGEYTSDLKLLVLFGKSNGNLEWKLSRYSDGSGRNYCDVWLCQSREEAMVIATELIEATYVGYREKPTGSHYIKGTAESAVALGLQVPEDILRMVKADDIANCEEQIRKELKALAAHQAKLAGLKGETHP